MEDMVVEGRPAKRMGTLRLGFLNDQCCFSLGTVMGFPNAGSRGISTALAMLSTVHRGAAFEKRALRLLQANLSMSLNRVGGKSDGGIDLRGWWWLPFTQNAFNDPTHRQRVRVFAQCKAEKKKIGPKYIREMEGVLHRHFDDPNPMVALFVSESLFTKEALLRMQSSSIPFFLLHLPSMHEDGIGSMVWNHALSGTNGLLQGKMEARWERSEDSDKVGRPSLWVQNQRAPSWTPEKFESYVVDHPLHVPHIILTIPHSDRNDNIRPVSGIRVGFWTMGCSRLLHAMQCDVNALILSPRLR